MNPSLPPRAALNASRTTIIKSWLARLSTTSWVAIGVFAFVLGVFSISRVHQITDSNYSMLLSQSLLEHGTFKLDAYALPRYEPMNRGYYISDGRIYQLEFANNHLYYHMPPGTSVLSVPFVALMRLFGVKLTNRDNTFDQMAEVRIQVYLAVLLISAVAVIFFYTARLMLSPLLSGIVAVGATLGSQAWSTASRGMWTDTWGLVLMSGVVLILLAQETQKRSINAVLLASLLAWSYFVRPTHSVHILAVAVYLLIYHRKYFLKYAATGAGWFFGFIFYSWHNYHHLLPAYYQSTRLNTSVFWTALAGNLISPSRGLLVFSPVLMFVAFLLLRYWKYVEFQRLVFLSLVIVVGHLISISAFPHWWGGHSYGPRFTTGLLPWLVLLTILGLEGLLKWRRARLVSLKAFQWRAQLAVGSLLLIGSMYIHARGATAHATWRWNSTPIGVDEYPAKLWDWHEPQFLAGAVASPYPKLFTIEDTVDFSTDESARYLFYGWTEKQDGFRWSNGKEAALAFALGNPITDQQLELRLAPFLAQSRIPWQRVSVTINGQPLDSFTLTDKNVSDHKVSLPKEALRPQNVIVFDLPDANSPRDLNLGDDTRQLGIALYSLRLSEPDPK